MKGHLVLEGRNMEIASVNLVEGRIKIVTKPQAGPFPAVKGGCLTVFGADGRGVAQTNEFDMEAIPAGFDFVLTHSIQVLTYETTEVGSVTFR